jgi:hypothetical protein
MTGPPEYKVWPKIFLGRHYGTNVGVKERVLSNISQIINPRHELFKGEAGGFFWTAGADLLKVLRRRASARHRDLG